jgi:hypothetical protein
MSWSRWLKLISVASSTLGLFLIAGTVIYKRGRQLADQPVSPSETLTLIEPAVFAGSGVLSGTDLPEPIRPSWLRGHSAAEQVAMMSAMAGVYPEEFEGFVFEPVNRYYLEPGSAFSRCGQTMSVVGHLVSGSGSSSDLWRGLEQKLNQYGMDFNGAEWRRVDNQAMQNIVALGETEGLVQFAFALGPERFQQSLVSRYLTINRDFIVRTLNRGFASDSEIKQILQQAFVQHSRMLASFAESYCSDIKPQSDPVPRGCGAELDIDKVSDPNDETEVLLLSDGSAWRITLPDDISVADWGPGDSVRVCQGFLLHESMISVEASRVQH